MGSKPMFDHRKILVVEDHPDVRRLMVMLLKREGYHVAEAASVAEGIAKLDGQAVALLDLHLPDGSGEEVLLHIRMQDHPTKVAFVTAAYDVVTLPLRSSPDAIFKKPIEIGALLDWISQQIETL
jgi:CheY-like chemotaxis protein